MKKLLLTTLVLLLAGTGSAAAAAPPDTWVRWISDSPQHTVRSLDFLGPTLFGSSDSGGVFSSASGTFADWSQRNTGLPDATARNVHQVQLNSLNGLLYAATSAGLFSSPPPGNAWQPVGSGIGPRKLNMGGAQSIVFNGPGDLVVAVAGATPPGVYFSADDGASWDRASGMPAGENVFHVSKGAPGTLWAAGDSGVWFSPNAGRSWVALSDGISPGETALRVSFVDGQHLYAATASTVYRTDNGGLTWEEADGADDQVLPAGAKRAFLMTPTLDGNFGDNRGVVGTEGGPWVTIDKGEHWLPMSSSTAPDAYADGTQNVRSSVIWSLGLGFSQPGLVAGNGFGVFHLPLWPVDATGVTVSPTSGLTVGKVLSANVTGLEGTRPYFVDYQWKRCEGGPGVFNCTPTTLIAGATSSQYVVPASDAGKATVRYAVQAQVKNLVRPTPKVLTSTPTAGVAATPGQTPRPSFALADQPKLTPAVSGPWGRTLTIAKGKWRTESSATEVTDDLDYVYRWTRCAGSACTPISGETEPTYTLTAEDVGTTIAGDVRGARKDNGASSAWFSAGSTGIVQNKVPVSTAPPKVLGDPFTGVLLSSSAGGWDGHDLRYERRWLRCNAEGLQCNPTNPVQTGSTYQLTAADRGSTLQLEVKAIGEDISQDRVATAYSAFTPVIADPPAVPGGGGGGGTPPPGGGTPPPGGGTPKAPRKPAVKIKRPKRLKVGATLTVPKRFAGFTKPRYQWLRNGKKIKKATKRSYRITRKDRGRRLTCRITLTAGATKVTVRTKAVKVPKR